MSKAIENLVFDISAAEPMRRRDAIVRAMLVLEWDGQGWLDRSVAEGFPQPELYEAAPTDADAVALIRGLECRIEDPGSSEEVRQSVLWALTKSRREEAFMVFMKLLGRTPDLKALCEATDVLEAVARFLADPIPRSQHAAAAAGLVNRLKIIDFSDPGAEMARKWLVANVHDQV